MFAIFDKENPNKCYFLESDFSTLLFTIYADKKWSIDDIVEINEDDVEQGYDLAFYKKGHTPTPPPEIQREIYKESRDNAIKNIVVTVNGLTFDGNKESQQSMLNAIQKAEILGQLEIEWILSDNTKQTVSIETLKQAFAFAVNETNRLWVQ